MLTQTGAGLPEAAKVDDPRDTGIPRRSGELQGERRTCPNVRVIVTSAYGQNMVDESFHGLKVDLFIRKPYRLAHLADMACRALTT